MSTQLRSTGVTCLTRPPTLRALRVGHGARLLVGEAVGGDPQDRALLGEVGHEALALVGDGVHVSGHDPNLSSVVHDR